jgi:cellulose synthase operon protein YhjU
MQNETSLDASGFPRFWRGLGAWNLYFLLKFALLWSGALNFHALENLAFAAALLLPLPPRWLHRLRHIVAIPVGFALFYYDTWLPPISRLLAARQDIAGFSTDYLLELAARTVNLRMVAAALVFWVVYLFLTQWLRLTVFTFAGLLYITLPSLHNETDTQQRVARAAMAPGTAEQADSDAVQAEVAPGTSPAGDGKPVPAAEPTSADLNAYLQSFYGQEEKRQTDFPINADQSAPFDILLLNICSLSWSDLDAVNLRDHPLFSKMDVVFDNFNSATSYSGPAGIRLARASCGQQSHSKLYDEPSPHCLLFDNLRQLGYAPELSLNHNGAYQDYIPTLGTLGHIPPPPKDVGPFDRSLVAFDGSPIWRDIDVLGRWWDRRQSLDAPRTVLFYNSITLHDGNRFIKPNGGTTRADFAPRAQMLLDDLSSFVGQLERAKRPVLLVLVPEHGASVRGDRLQIAGLREIPSPGITQIPVAIKMIGAKASAPRQTIHISQPTSYLAVSEVIARLIREDAFSSQEFDLERTVADLPETPAVSENEGAIVVRYGDKAYIQLAKSDWQPYPQ